MGSPFFYEKLHFLSVNAWLVLIIELARLTKKSSCFVLLIFMALGDLKKLSFIEMASNDFFDEDLSEFYAGFLMNFFTL